MMGEAEFAFVVAVFGVSEGLIPPDIYASVVFAILVSTVISPLLLRTTLAIFPYNDDDDNDDNNSNGKKVSKNHLFQRGPTDSYTDLDESLRLVVVQMNLAENRTVVQYLSLMQKILITDLDVHVLHHVSWCDTLETQDDGKDDETLRRLAFAAVVSIKDEEAELDPALPRFKERLQQFVCSASEKIETTWYSMDSIDSAPLQAKKMLLFTQTLTAQ
jgi:hypothetical protein